jgi:hypothetical protein
VGVTGGYVAAGNYIFFYRTRNENHQLGTGFLYIGVSAVKRVQFVSDRMLYTLLKGHWCNTTDFNVHATNKEKSDHSKDSFYEKLEQVFLSLP